MNARVNRMPRLVAGGCARDGRLFRYEGTERITDGRTALGAWETR